MSLFKEINIDYLSITEFGKSTKHIGYMIEEWNQFKFLGEDFKKGIASCNTDGDVMKMESRIKKKKRKRIGLFIFI